MNNPFNTKYEEEIEFDFTTMYRCFIPFWAMSDLGWRYGSLLVLMSTSVLFAVLGGIFLFSKVTIPFHMSQYLILLACTWIPIHAFIFWKLMRKYNERVRSYKNSNANSN
jgi:hypothetical protein